MPIIDLRSDTVTKPSKEMLNEMMQAPVGDDVYGEDPTVNELEEKCAKLFAMEDAIFCPSGTMTNQIAIKAHTQPGDDVICDINSHIYQYEGGGIAFNAACSVSLLQGDRGRITAQQVLEAIQPDDIHKPHTSLVSLENTSNRGGGSCYDIKEIERIKAVCQSHHLALHLDGARLMNAIVAKNENPVTYGKLFDSISLCLSKGLGAPVGSVLIGSEGFIRKCRRIRKAFGGGMRQAGILAAAGIFALENNVERLKEDHAHAASVAEALEECRYVDHILSPETNIIIFTVKDITPAAFQALLKEHNIQCNTMGNGIRFVFHLDIQPEMITFITEKVKSL